MLRNEVSVLLVAGASLLIGGRMIKDLLFKKADTVMNNSCALFINAGTSSKNAGASFKKVDAVLNNAGALSINAGISSKKAGTSSKNTDALFINAGTSSKTAGTSFKTAGASFKNDLFNEWNEKHKFVHERYRFYTFRIAIR